MNKKTVALMLALKMLTNPALGFAAAPTIPGFYGQVQPPAINTLPVARGNTYTGVDSITTDPSKNQMTITQTSANAVINWDSFNIGAKATVYFSQKDKGVAQPTWAALNRIYDQSPSLIYGSLKADGKIYLINQNGILFGPNSQVNVNSLIASTMNLRDGDFLNGIFNFTAENYQSANYDNTFTSDGTDPDNAKILKNLNLTPPDSQAIVANYGAIQTDQGGKVYLLGPDVENYGSITTPSGSSSLVSALPLSSRTSASSLFDIQADANNTVIFNRDVSAAAGFAANRSGGLISADAGFVGLYGKDVNQEGIIRAVTALKQNGQIELRATERIYTAPGSQTISPVSNSGDKFLESSFYQAGKITLAGITTEDNNNILPVLIEHWGSIEAPSGNINMFATNRVFLGTGSSINVGGVWVDEPAGANIVNAQLNSVELNNDYGQKNGILKGQNVNVNPLDGTAIGNLNATYTLRELTAQERSTTGGSITIGSGTNTNTLAELIVKDGANLNFTGGGLHYAMGTVDTTMLLSGTNVVPISSASEWTTYDKILGQQQVVHAKYGITESYQGLYMGGGTSVLQLAGNFVQGSDAGALKLQARLQVLDGQIDGSVMSGPYQTKITTDPTARQLSMARGLEQPNGGTLLIGDDSPAASTQNNDFILGDLVVKQTATPLNAGFGPDDPLNRQQTILSAALLNAAGLSKLTLATNTSLTVDANARLALSPGSTLSIIARKVDNLGSIRIPDGSVNVTLLGNITESPTLVGGSNANPNYLEIDERISLAGGSSIDVSGEQVDNSRAAAGGDPLVNPHTGGGTVTLMDLTDQGHGVFVNKGALLDVSGGYAVDPKGKLTGGNAGTLELLGNAVEIRGELRGLAMAGSAGGTLILHAGTVSLGEKGAITPPDGTNAVDDPGGLYMPLGILADSGFSNLDIRSRGDLTLGKGLELVPSLARYAPPAQGSDGAVTDSVNGVSATQNIVVVDPTIAGTTAVSLRAGVKFDPTQPTLRDSLFQTTSNALMVESGATVRTTPEGNIAISGPAVTVNGTLEAPGGTVKVATNNQNDLVLGANARILAGGYNLVNSTMVGGIPAGWSPQPGGTVTLNAVGNLIIDSGSLIDVSGSQPVSVISAGADGRPTPTMAAGAPGSVTLSFAGELTLDGKLNGRAYMAGLPEGALTVKNFSAMTPTASEIALYQAWGFDDLTFSSTAQINLTEDMSINARRLTFDTPILYGASDSVIDLKAPWITLINSASQTSATDQNSGVVQGNAHLNVTAEWIDLTGKLTFSGFQETRLTASNDIRLSDRLYKLDTVDINGTPISGYVGELKSSGDLILDAARSYPTTLSHFSILSAGKITVLQRDGGSSPVVSAGGILDIEAANGIDVQGTLLAPMGQITLNSSNGRVLLEPGSLVSTTGGSAVPYGQLDANGLWTIPNRENVSLSTDVTATPVQSIQLAGKEVIVTKGARVDASGGGSVFSEVFQPGIEGSKDPLPDPIVNLVYGSIMNRYVILPDNSIVIPGKSIYLAGGGGVAPGVYSILPVDYAFLPGAMIVTDQGITVAKGVQQKSADGNSVVAGYFTDQGTNVKPSFFEGYTIQPASVILQQGNFTTKELVAGNGGAISLRGTTTILSGSVSAKGLTGFSGGSLEVGGQNITVSQAGSPLPEQFDFSTPLGLTGTLLSTSSFVGKGFQAVSLGVSGDTDTVTVSAGSTVDVPNISITANRSITLESGAQLRGVGADGTGSVNLISGETDNKTGSVINSGNITIGENSIIHAGNAFSLNVMTRSGDAPSVADLRGTVSVDSGTASLTGERITLINDSDTDRSGGGIFLSESQWNLFKSVTNLSLTSSSDLTFRGDFSLSAGGNVTIDAARISGAGNVSLTATGLSLMNSGKSWSEILKTTNTGMFAMMANQTGTLAMQADRITVGTGDILLDGFGTVQLLAKQDLTLQGTGFLRTSLSAIDAANNTVSYGWSGYNAAQSLELQGARIVSALARNSDGTFSAADFTVDAGYGALSVTSSGVAPAPATAPGGYLSLKANYFDISGTITAPGGTLVVTTTDKDPSAGISLTGNASLNVVGLTITPAVYAEPSSIPGGKVELITGRGTLLMGQGTSIDVSGNGGSDAGAIVISAPNSAVDLQGNLSGNSNGGQGGSFSLDAGSIVTPLAALFGKLTTGGFTTAVDLRQRGGNINSNFNSDLLVDAGSSMTAREIRLTADSGSITVAGKLDASAAGTGGSVELYAGKDLTVSGSISAAGATGGYVTLSSEEGAVNLAQGSKIDVSGSQQGGTVTLRAPWINDGFVSPGNVDTVAMSIGNGSIVGARQVVAEGVQVYSYAGTGTLMGTSDTNFGSPNLGSTGTGPSTIYFNDLFNDMGAIMTNHGADVLSNLNAQSGLATAGIPLHLRPEIEVRTAGDLTVSSDIILADTGTGAAPVRFTNSEPGNLTLRAGGNLIVSGSIIDAPTSLSSLKSSNNNRNPSWGITLAAGADLGSADPTAVQSMPVQSGTRDLTISDGARVYTESAPLRFASGGNTYVGTATSSAFIPNNLAFTIGTYDGAIRGKVGGDLDLSNGGVIQTATAPITLHVDNSLNLSYTGAIRTTGESTGPGIYFWTYDHGGSLKLNIDGAVAGNVNSGAWDTDYFYNGVFYWSPSIQATETASTTSGIVTLGGGDISIRCGLGFSGQAGTFGPGNFTLSTGGDILPSRFLFKSGTSRIIANGSVGSAGDAASMALEDFGAQIFLTAGGRIDMGTIANPTLTNPDLNVLWDVTYTHADAAAGTGDSSVRLSALAGDISLVGESSYYGATTDTPDVDRKRVLPPSVELYAAGSIHLKNRFTISPSPTGNLRLAAKGDIDGLYIDSSGQTQHGLIYMSDQDPAVFYKNQPIPANANQASDYIYGYSLHAAIPVHGEDTAPALFSAGGDIRDLDFYLPKQANLLAGQDIRDIYASFQNLAADDKTVVAAGRDIVFSAGNAAFQGVTGIVAGGPGQLLVQAGGNIDLGTSKGIQTIGDYENPALGTKGATIIVAAGIDYNDYQLSVADEKDFFSGLRQAGSDYANLKAKGDSAAAIARINDARTQLIAPRFSGGVNNGSGSIDMVNSSISTLSGKDDIYIMARSLVNAGLSTFVSDTQRQASGIFTASGGAINIFSGGDLNVNESRVMTYLGGDITAWSDQGSINAGRGSKTSVNSQPPHLVSLGGNPPVFKTVFTPPSAGSGIRALTYDQATASPGDIYLFAPQGVIDAGEAGIAGGKVILGATEVLNAKNISFSVSSVGVPSGSEAGVSLGSLAGAGSVAETSKMAAQSTISNVTDKQTQQTNVVDQFLSKFLDVKVINFDTDEGNADNDKQDEEKRKKK